MTASIVQRALPKTRDNYEAAGYAVQEKPSQISTDTLWIVGKEGREAVILWSNVADSTIYLSCLTAGAPASDP